MHPLTRSYYAYGIFPERVPILLYSRMYKILSSGFALPVRALR